MEISLIFIQSQKGHLYEEKVRVLCKTRLIFPRINGPNMHCKLNEPISARRKRRKTRQQITTNFDWLRTCRESFESITRH